MHIYIYTGTRRLRPFMRSPSWRIAPPSSAGRAQLLLPLRSRRRVRRVHRARWLRSGRLRAQAVEGIRSFAAGPACTSHARAARGELLGVHFVVGVNGKRSESVRSTRSLFKVNLLSFAMTLFSTLLTLQRCDCLRQKKLFSLSNCCHGCELP